MTTGGKILTGVVVVGGIYVVYKLATMPKTSTMKTSSSGLSGAANAFVSTVTSALGYFGNQPRTPMMLPAVAPGNTPYTYNGVTYSTSGGAGTVDTGPANFSQTAPYEPGASATTPYAPGASAPGPYAPPSDLMAGDSGLTDTSTIT